jgi:hypothetical protein
MRSFKLVLLLVVLALSSLAGHRKKATAGCQCPEEDLRKVIRVLGKSASLSPEESGSLDFTALQIERDELVLANWNLLSWPASLIQQNVDVPKGAASSVSVGVTVRPAAELPKEIQFGIGREGLRGDVCLAAAAEPLYQGGNGCASVQVQTPGLIVEPLGSSSATVRVYNASPIGWSITYVVPKHKAHYLTVKETPLVATADGVGTVFGVEVSPSAPSDRKDPPCVFGFYVTVSATNGDLTLWETHDFRVPVACQS